MLAIQGLKQLLGRNVLKGTLKAAKQNSGEWHLPSVCVLPICQNLLASYVHVVCHSVEMLQSAQVLLHVVICWCLCMLPTSYCTKDALLLISTLGFDRL